MTSVTQCRLHAFRTYPGTSTIYFINHFVSGGVAECGYERIVVKIVVEV